MDKSLFINKMNRLYYIKDNKMNMINRKEFIRKIIIQLIFFLSLFLFSYSCMEEIPYQKESFTPKLVLNGGITRDSLISIQLTSTQDVEDTSLKIVKNATVELFINNNFAGNLKYDSNGIYTSTVRAELGKTYKIKAYCDNYDTISASTEIPEKLQINNCSLVYNYGVFFDGEPSSKLTVNITDRDEKHNFYYINHFLLNDSFFMFISPIDPASLAGTHDGESVIFNDQQFKSSSYNLVFSISRADRDTFFYSIIINTISESYYRFLISIFDYIDANNNNYFKNNTESPEVYSNVKNGYGVFYGYNRTIKFFHYKKQKQ